jgi:hypothetical protein
MTIYRKGAEKRGTRERRRYHQRKSIGVVRPEMKARRARYRPNT